MWIVELLQFLFSFLPSIQIIEPDTRQVVYFIRWNWVRKPGISILWPFWIAKQEDVTISHFNAAGSYTEDMMRTRWEATLYVSDPIAFAYQKCGDDDEFISSVITRSILGEIDINETLEPYGIACHCWSTTDSGIPVINFN